MRVHHIILALIIFLTISSSCKKEDFQPELIAKTGADTTASIGDTVWLDASASIGSGYQLMWTFHNQPGDDTISRANTDSAFFIPYSNGSYQVKLTLTKGDLFHSDYQNVLVSGAVILEDEITSRTRLSKIALPGETDYLVTGELSVAAELIVDLGVIIEFRTDASLVVEDGGSIYAESASFIPADSTWKGILIKSTGNSFTGCLIHNAGNSSLTGDAGDKAGIIMTGGASLAFSGNTLSNSGGYGIIVKDGGNFFEDTENGVNAYFNNKFIKNASGPMVIPVHVLSYLAGQKFEEESPDTYIEIYESAYAASSATNPRLDDVGMPYMISGLLTFNKDLLINKGVKMYFDSEGGLLINGKLGVSGTSDAPVMMDGLNSTPGSWMGIYVKGGQVSLDYLHLLNAGNTAISGLTEKASLTVENLFTMNNSTLTGSGGIGINLRGNAHIRYSNNFTGNSLENNAISAVRIRMDDVSKVVNGNTVKSLTSVPAIEVFMGIDDPLGTWTNLDADWDYKVLESLTIKATKKLLIEDGVSIKMSPGTTLTVSGGLLALGLPGSEITIEGTASKKGHWDGIFINSTDTVQLDRVLIRDGGGAFEDKGNLIIQSTAKVSSGSVISVTHSGITNSKGYGVLIKSGASDFSINEPASGNTLEGDLGGFHDENQ